MSDLQQARQMSIPQAHAAKQNVSANKKRGVLVFWLFRDADRVAHVAARLIHLQDLDQPGRKYKRHGKTRLAEQRSGHR